MAKVLVDKLGDLSLIPGTHVKVKRELTPQSCPLISTRAMAQAHTQ